MKNCVFHSPAIKGKSFQLILTRQNPNQLIKIKSLNIAFVLRRKQEKSCKFRSNEKSAGFPKGCLYTLSIVISLPEKGGS